MLFWAYPNVAIAPLAQLTKLLNLWVVVLDIVLLRETGWVVDSNIAAEAVEDACSFEGEEARI